ncbi:MAG: class I SAM-dependent methyltransferase [Bdellovibrio sp.]
MVFLIAQQQLSSGMVMIYKDGIWFAENSESISYPSIGNDSCFQVEDRSFWFRNRSQLIKEIILKFVGKTQGRSFLDLGGGNGVVAKKCQDLGFETYLAEPGNGVFNARTRGIKNIYCCKLQELPQDMKFDCIGLFDVLEHIDSSVSFLEDVKGYLKEEGHLFITVPAYNFLWSDEDVLAGHCRRYTVSRLTEELRKAGFKVQFKSYFFLALLPLIFFLRALPFKFNSGTQKPHSENSGVAQNDHVLPSWLDNAFNFIFKVERFLIQKVATLPIGSSIILVAKK